MKRVQKLFSALGGLCLAGVFIIVFAQVIQRYVFQLSIPWANDAIQILFIYSVFLGMAIGVFNKSHLNVDVVLQAFSPRARQWFAILSDVVMIVFLSAVMKYSVRFVADNMDQYMTYLRMPMSYIYAVIPITVVFMLIFLAMDLIRLTRAMGSSGDLSREGR